MSIIKDSHDICSSSSKNELRDNSSDDDSDIPSLLEEKPKRKPSPAKKRAPSPAKETRYTTPPTPKIPPPKALNPKQKKTPDEDPKSLESHYDIIQKLNRYSERMPQLFSKDELKAWNSGENNFTEDRARTLIKSIRTRLNTSKKTKIVDKLFCGACDISESLLVNFTEDTEMYGFATFIKTNREVFSDDLDELAIEMGDSLIPGPKISILMNIYNMYHVFKGLKAKEREQKIIEEANKKN